jgi:hypothetical protein
MALPTLAASTRSDYRYCLDRLKALFADVLLERGKNPSVLGEWLAEARAQG